MDWIDSLDVTVGTVPRDWENSFAVEVGYALEYPLLSSWSKRHTDTQCILFLPFVVSFAP
jgi:hypothetical protein